LFSAEEGGIWSVDVDGSALTKVIADGVNPSWSPDGSRIAYELAPYELGAGTLLIAAADGTRVSEFSYAGSGAWNPLSP
jgi:Tol biopolymer transport system component